MSHIFGLDQELSEREIEQVSGGRLGFTAAWASSFYTTFAVGEEGGGELTTTVMGEGSGEATLTTMAMSEKGASS
ncbi:hypothetical protein [Arhodomonas sp. AD133]|uniref:hypothetical protein n=1 Tax=Arhodomonas sp. AD133 TaxID=3415009 RepID=UPI003EBFC168